MTQEQLKEFGEAWETLRSNYPDDTVKLSVEGNASRDGDLIEFTVYLAADNYANTLVAWSNTPSKAVSDFIAKHGVRTAESKRLAEIARLHNQIAQAQSELSRLEGK